MSDEVELDDDDLVVVDEPLDEPQPLEEPLARAVPSAALAWRSKPVRAAFVRPPAAMPIVTAGARARSAIPAGSRRVVDERVEHDVAGECLASIAAATVGSHVRVAPARPPRLELLEALEPSPDPPTLTRVVGPVTSVAPGVVPTTPAAAFVRRSSPSIPAAASAFPVRVGATSVAPVTLSQHPTTPSEATVIVVRERPKTAWVIASAAVGALCAIAVSRLLSAGAPEAHPPVAAAQVAPPAPPSTIVVAPSPAAAPLAVQPVMSFSEEPGVAIIVPVSVAHPPSKAPEPAPAGAASARPPVRAVPARPGPAPLGPSLPDGSFGLGRADTPRGPDSLAIVATTPPPASAGTAAEPPRRRPLTPEQQLAAAQLKASMR